jgi:lysozyme
MNAPHPGKAKLVGLIGAVCASVVLYCVPAFEGVVLRGYKDPIGIVTACAGHTATAVLGRPYTEEECHRLLVEDLVHHAEGVNRCLSGPVTDGQRAAAVSFTFNVGISAFCKSTFRKKLDARDPTACAELSRWIHADGKVLPGLVKRRAAERAICEGRHA